MNPATAERGQATAPAPQDPTYEDRRLRIHQNVPALVFLPNKAHSINEEDLMGDWTQHLLHHVARYKRDKCPKDLGLTLPKSRLHTIYIGIAKSRPRRAYVGSAHDFVYRRYQHIELNDPNSNLPWDIEKRDHLDDILLFPVLAFSDKETFDQHRLTVEQGLMKYLRDEGGYIMWNVIWNGYDGAEGQWLRFDNGEGRYTCVVAAPSTEPPAFIPLSKDVDGDPLSSNPVFVPVMINGYLPNAFSNQRHPAMVDELVRRFAAKHGNNAKVMKEIEEDVKEDVRNGIGTHLATFTNFALKGHWYELIRLGYPPALELEERFKQEGAENAKRRRTEWTPEDDAALFKLVSVHGATFNHSLTVPGEERRRVPGEYAAFDRMVEAIKEDPEHLLAGRTASSLANHWIVNKNKPAAVEALKAYNTNKTLTKEERKAVVLDAVKETAIMKQMTTNGVTTMTVTIKYEKARKYLADRGYEGMTDAAIKGVWGYYFRDDPVVNAEVTQYINNRVAAEAAEKKRQADEAWARILGRSTAPPAAANPPIPVAAAPQQQQQQQQNPIPQVVPRSPLATITQAQALGKRKAEHLDE